jgi:hypothetical protein
VVCGLLQSAVGGGDIAAAARASARSESEVLISGLYTGSHWVVVVTDSVVVVAERGGGGGGGRQVWACGDWGCWPGCWLLLAAGCWLLLADLRGAVRDLRPHCPLLCAAWLLAAQCRGSALYLGTALAFWLKLALFFVQQELKARYTGVSKCEVRTRPRSPAPDRPRAHPHPHPAPYPPPLLGLTSSTPSQLGARRARALNCGEWTQLWRVHSIVARALNCGEWTQLCSGVGSA